MVLKFCSALTTKFFLNPRMGIGHHLHLRNSCVVLIRAETSVDLFCIPERIVHAAGKEPFISSHLFREKLAGREVLFAFLVCKVFVFDRTSPEPWLMFLWRVWFDSALRQRKSPLSKLLDGLAAHHKSFYNKLHKPLWCLNIYGCLWFPLRAVSCQKLNPALMHLDPLQASYLRLVVKTSIQGG